MIPIEEIIKFSRNVEPSDRAWQRLIAGTGQPSFLNEVEEDRVIVENIAPRTRSVSMTQI